MPPSPRPPLSCENLKAVIVAGGYGTRLSEETQNKPKPMVEIGGRPILWHIMKLYGYFGVRDFVICLGYKGYAIKEYFANLNIHSSDVTIDLASGSTRIHASATEPWCVTLIDTGHDTMTGGRIKRVKQYLDPVNPFFLTYGDGLSNVDMESLLNEHQRHGKLATVTSVAPPGRYGSLRVKDDRVVEFSEKPPGDGSRINGGFFVLEPGVQDYIAGDDTSFEGEPLINLARNGELMTYGHDGFWMSMDTLRDRVLLEELWAEDAPWKLWND